MICVVLMSLEIFGGIKANSLAVLGDAAHLLSDVAAFAISLFSLWASGWEANPSKSYGYFRIEILGSLLSILMIWLLTVILVYGAITRFLSNNAGEVHGVFMFAFSAFGVVANIAMALILGHKHGEHSHAQLNINVQEAYLHVLGDFVQSVSAMIIGAVIWFIPECKIFDPICILVFSVIVLGTAIWMLRNILEVLMESTPRKIDANRIEKGLCDMDEVVEAHELHVWAITKVLLTCHVKINPDAEMVLDKVIEYIKREYNTSHVTIQIEGR